MLLRKIILSKKSNLKKLPVSVERGVYRLQFDPGADILCNKHRERQGDALHISSPWKG